MEKPTIDKKPFTVNLTVLMGIVMGVFFAVSWYYEEKIDQAHETTKLIESVKELNVQVAINTTTLLNVVNNQKLNNSNFKYRFKTDSLQIQTLIEDVHQIKNYTLQNQSLITRNRGYTFN